MSSDSLLVSLRVAVDAAPEDVPLRLHLAETLAAAVNRAEAVRQAGGVLQRDPENAAALRLIANGSVSAESGPPMPPAEVAGDGEAETLRRLESELADVAPPMYVNAEADVESDYEIESVGLRLTDVAGMAEVKARLEAAVLAPMRNPELTQLYGRSLRGGLLLYGPPGCGRRLSRARLPARWTPTSWRCRSRTCSTCTSVRASATFAGSSRRPAAVHRASCSWMRSTHSAKSAATCVTAPPAGPSTSCCPRWMV